MRSKFQNFPTRKPASTGARLGRHRHFSGVTPFLRVNFVLRRAGGFLNESFGSCPSLAGDAQGSGRAGAPSHVL